MVMSKRLALERNRKAKFQILIYPAVNIATFNKPSTYFYRQSFDGHFTLAKNHLWYMGIRQVTKEMEDAINANDHTLLLSDSEKQRFNSYLNYSLIPEQYKRNRSYYETFKDIKPIKFDARLPSSSILLRDRRFAYAARSLFNEDSSPLLSSLEKLKLQPKTFQLACEIDDIKDDGIVLYERLKQANVDVKFSFYDDCSHGMIMNQGNDVALRILDEISDYINKNI